MLQKNVSQVDISFIKLVLSVECATKHWIPQIVRSTKRNSFVKTAMLENTDLRDTDLVVELDAYLWIPEHIYRESKYLDFIKLGYTQKKPQKNHLAAIVKL